MLGLFVLGTLCGLLWALERWLDNPQVYPGGPVTQYGAWASFRRFTGVGFAAWRVCLVAGCGAFGLTCEPICFRGQLWGRSHKVDFGRDAFIRSFINQSIFCNRKVVKVNHNKQANRIDYIC
jgi:hypothetical protein